MWHAVVTLARVIGGTRPPSLPVMSGQFCWGVRKIGLLSCKKCHTMACMTFGRVTLLVMCDICMTFNPVSSRLKFESGDDLNDALADCNKALDLDFYEPAVFYFRGAIQRNIGDFEEAIKSCCIAIKLDPKSEEVYKEQILMLEESVQEKLTAISDETDFDAKEKLNSVLNLINEEKKSF